MNLIEQYIRKIILERDKTEVTTLSGYQIKILSSYIGDSEVERLRSKLVNDRAQENGCIQGFMIVAKKKNEKSDDSKLFDDVVEAMKTNKTLMQYYNKDYRLILSSPRKTSKRRKVFAVWILDMRNTSEFKQLLMRINNNVIQPLGKDISRNFNKFLTNETDVITQSQAILWINNLTEYLDTLKTSDTYVYNKIINPNDKRSSRLINSIPDFNKMLVGVNVDANSEFSNLKNGDIVTVDQEFQQKYNFSSTFRGKALVKIDVITGKPEIIPIEGALYANTFTSETTDADVMAFLPKFEGTFVNGRPSEGIFWFIDNATQKISAKNDGDPYYYQGTFDSTAAERYTFKFDTGKLYYWSKNDDEYGYFDGKFKNQDPWTGDTWQRLKPNLPYRRYGNLINGKAKTKIITFPYSYTLNTKYYLDTTDDTKVYGYFKDSGRWIQASKDSLVDLIDKELNIQSYGSSAVPIVDPDQCATLCKTFSEVDNFFTIKPNTDSKIQIFIYKKVGTAYKFKIGRAHV